MDDTAMTAKETAALFLGTIVGALSAIGVTLVLRHAIGVGPLAAGATGVVLALTGSLAGLGAWQRFELLTGLARLRVN